MCAVAAIGEDCSVGGEGWQGCQEECSGGCKRHTQDACLPAAQHAEHAQISVKAVRPSAAPTGLFCHDMSDADAYRAASTLWQAGHLLLAQELIHPAREYQ